MSFPHEAPVVYDKRVSVAVMEAGWYYFAEPKTRMGRVGTIQMILAGMYGYRPTEAMVCRGLMTMANLDVSFSDRALRGFIRGAQQDLETEQTIRDVERLLGTSSSLTAPDEPM